jgi:hypothetical protein
METQHVWFVPMLEGLLAPQAAEVRRDLEMWVDDTTHDAAQRQIRVLSMASASGRAYNAMENEAIERGLAMMALFDGSSGGLKQLPHSATIDRSEMKHDDASGLLLGRSDAVIRGATPQAVAAYLLHFGSRHIKSNRNPATDLRTEALEYVDSLHTVIFNRFRLGAGLRERTFLNSVIAKKLEDAPTKYVVVGMPIPIHAKLSPKEEAGAIRAENCRCFMATEVTPGVTHLQYVCSLDLKGLVPQAITNKIVTPGQMHGAHLALLARSALSHRNVLVRAFLAVPRTLQLYFQQLRPLSECSADDGQVVGHMLMDLMEGKPKDARLAILKFVNHTAMLRECSYPHIGEMLVALLMFTPQSDSKPSPAVVAQTTALATEEEASRIGSALASIIHSSRTAAEAVQTALRLHAVLRTTTSAHIWFVPMVEAMAERMSAGAARPLAAAHFVHRRSWVHRPSASVQPGKALEPPLGSADNVDIGDGQSSFNSVVCRFEPSCHVHQHAWSLLRS